MKRLSLIVETFFCVLSGNAAHQTWANAATKQQRCPSDMGQCGNEAATMPIGHWPMWKRSGNNAHWTLANVETKRQQCPSDMGQCGNEASTMPIEHGPMWKRSGNNAHRRGNIGRYTEGVLLHATCFNCLHL